MSRTRRMLRILLSGLALLLLALGAVIAFGLWRSEQLMNRRIELPRLALEIASEPAAIERGRYLFASRGCADCHGADGGGRHFIDSGDMQVVGPHIAPGPGSRTASYQPQDWEHTIRHGVKPDGRPLLIMPSGDYNRLTDADLSALVAYVRQLPAVQGLAARMQLPLPVRVLYGLGQIPDAAGLIDHRLPPARPVPEGATVEHGRYVAQMCTGCHGAQLAGGKVPGGPPEWPAAAQLTPGEASAMARYPSLEAFRQMLQSGRRPDGSAIAVMPFEALSKLNEPDVAGLYTFLKSLPAPARGG